MWRHIQLPKVGSSGLGKSIITYGDLHNFMLIVCNDALTPAETVNDVSSYFVSPSSSVKCNNTRFNNTQ